MAVQHFYNPTNGGYNANGQTMHTVRAKIALAVQGVSDCHILAAGDSTLGGYGGATYAYDTNPVRSMARQISARTGVPWQQGLQYAGAQTNLAADNWTLVAPFAVAASILACNGAGTATRAALPGETGKSVDIIYSDLSTNGIPWKINGAAQTPLASGGTNTLRKVTVGSLTLGPQVIQIAPTAGQFVAIMATRVYDPTVKALHVHNLSVGGSRAASGTGSACPHNLDWSSISTSGLYGLGWIMPNTLLAAGITPDFLIVSIGGNDLGSAATVAATAAGMDAMFTLFGGTPPGMIWNAHKISTVADTLQNQMSAAKYQHADSLNKSMFNWDDIFGGWAGASADGLIGADLTHPGPAMQVEIGKYVGSLIGA